ncbi:MAG TPA: MBL fold metallo-hydrolase [Blastocatellia bacterium]|nr:MBL fold metallo-hydrolase [Blastocatellia bacterium]
MFLQYVWVLVSTVLITGHLPGTGAPAEQAGAPVHSAAVRVRPGSSQVKDSSMRQAEEARSPARNFEVQKLAEGVYAVIRKDLPGLMVDANSVFIINDEDVVVVDTSGAPSTSKEVVAALKKLTGKPVKYVVNTHWHDDHIIGDPVYQEAFPGVEFIAHARMREYLPNQGAVNRKGFLQGAPGALESLKSALAKDKSISGAPISQEERESYASDIRLVELALAEAPGTRLTLPTITLEDHLTLYRGDRVIDIRHLGSGHTGGDIVVHLPREGIVITGDLVVWPVPLVGAEQSHIGEWSATLEKLRALKPSIIVPGHGPVMRDDSYVKLMSDLFASIKQQTEAAVTRGETLAQARKSVSLGDLRKQFAGDSAVRKVLFDIYVAGPAVAAAFREASAKR